MGGGLGLLPKSPLFYEKLDRLSGVKTTIITGNNRVLYDRLRDRYPSVQVVGYTDKVHEFMADADLILTKPGGITLFETIRSELPCWSSGPTFPRRLPTAVLSQKIKLAG